MKKMTTAKILALSLIASLLLPVTACKKKTGTGETGRKNDERAVGQRRSFRNDERKCFS